MSRNYILYFFFTVLATGVIFEVGETNYISMKQKQNMLIHIYVTMFNELYLPVDQN